MATVEVEATAAARIEESVELQRRLLEVDHLSVISRAAASISSALRAGGKVILFGNGGSAADAQHIAGEFLGRYLLERRALPAIALADNSATVTAIANDYSYEEVFSRQLEGLCSPYDVVMGISTSGTSLNVTRGILAARDIGAVTIGLTGKSGGLLADCCDICIRFPSSQTPRIQEGHILIAHILCELVEAEVSRDI